METLIKSLSGHDHLQKLIINSPQNKNEPLEFYFINYHQNLSNTEINILCENLLQEDQTKVLSISHQKDFINTVALSKFVDRSRCLRRLDVSCCEIRNFGPIFEALGCENQAEKNVEAGSLADSHEQDHHLDDEDKKNLQFLDISGNEISFEDVKILSQKLKTNKTLLALKLNNCKLKIDSIIRLLEGLNENNTLESLDLSRQSRLVENYNLSMHVQKYFSNNTKTLVRLSLRHLNLSDQAIHNIILGLLNGSNSLQHLDISNNNLSRDSANSIVKLLSESSDESPQIKTLNLSNNRIENEGTIKIFNVLKEKKNQSLKTLIIKSIEASQAAWQVAESVFGPANSENGPNLSLSELYIWGNDFKGQQGAASLKNLIDNKRFKSGRTIDVQPYVVDGVIWMAEDGVSCGVAEGRFHEVVDGEDDY